MTAPWAPTVAHPSAHWRLASRCRGLAGVALLLGAGCSGDALSGLPGEPTVAAISPATAVQGTTAIVTLTGANFVVNGTTVLALGGDGVTVDAMTVMSGTSATAHVTIAADATLGPRALTLTTASGGSSRASGAPVFTILPPPPTLSGLSAATVVEGTTVTDTLTGTNFVPGATTIAVSGTGVTATNLSVVSSTTLTATLTVEVTAPLGAREVTVTTAGGTAAPQTLTVNPPAPTLASVSPAAGVTATTVQVTLVGTGFVPGATAVTVRGEGVTVSGVSVGASPARTASTTQPAIGSNSVTGTGTALTASFVIGEDATLGAHDVMVSTAGGTSGVVAFTVKAPEPTIGAFAASPTTVKRGQASTLTWSGIANATSCAIDNGVGTVSCAGGSKTVSPAVSTAYRLTASGAGGSITGTATVTVNQPPTIAEFTASPATIIVGGATTLSWDGLTDATTCSIDQGVGNVSCDGGSTSVSPTSTTTYTLTANGPGGDADATVTVTVNAPPVLTSVDPSSGAPGATVAVTLTGTNFAVGATTVAVSGTGVTVSNVSVASTTSLTANFVVAAGAAAGSRDVTVTTAGGTSGAKTFSVAGAGRYVYATSSGSNTVSMLAINSSTGTLTPIGGGTVATGATPFGIAVDPAGRYAYVGDFGMAAVSSYTIGGSGALTANGGTVATGGGPRRLVVDPTGRFLYVMNQFSNSVSAYTIGATGQLTANGPAIATGSQPVDIAVDPLGRYVYVANFTSSNASMYVVNADGTLSANGTVSTGLNPAALTVDPTGKYVYVANRTANSVSMYAITGTGTLSSIGAAAATGSSPMGIAVDPTGRYVYVTAVSENAIRMYTITQSTGALVANGTVATGVSPSWLTVEPGGAFVYVTNQSSNTVSMYAITGSGTLTSLGTVSIGNGPFGITSSR